MERTPLSTAKIVRLAQLAFEFSDRLDPREIRRVLLARLRREVDRRGMDASEADLRRGLDLILSQHSRLVAEAARACMGQVVESADSDEIPKAIYAHEPLDHSRLNIYRVFPKDMGGWERRFAEYLDEDDSETVLWWHRNPDSKDHSVGIVKADEHRYFPDFVVGVSGHAAPDGSSLRLVEVKERLNDPRNEAANRSQHRAYGSVIMVKLDTATGRWNVVRCVEGTGTNQIDREFDYPVLRSWV